MHTKGQAMDHPGTGEATAPAVDGLAGMEARLGYCFGDRSLLELALTHPSITHDLGAGTPHNQRLEFLGDAVLQLVLTSELYGKFPALGEGLLTQARAEMVNRRTLATQSRALGAGGYLRMSRSEESTGGRDRASALADAFEALVGAIFLDAGLEPARSFILRRFREAFGELEALPSLHNPKGELQELLQAESSEAPSYRLVTVSGPDHDRLFECAVSYRGSELGRGSGKTKKAAESEAAREALLALKRAKDGAEVEPSGAEDGGARGS
jgi:ribonuclease-3